MEQFLIKRLLDAADSSGINKVFSKGEYLIKEGQVEQSIYFIESGAVRVFHVTEFEEQTIRFGYEGSIITSLSSFITGKAFGILYRSIKEDDGKNNSKAIVA